MTEVWKLSSDYYCLYTESKEIMYRIRRYYPDFKIMAEYFKFDQIKAIQYLIPVNRKRVAYRLKNVV